MPTIYDNIDKNLVEGLSKSLETAKRVDMCVGYFNLRGWSGISGAVDKLEGQDKNYCRLIIGMPSNDLKLMHNIYDGNCDVDADLATINRRKKEVAQELSKQLEYGIPTRQDEITLRKFVKQLKSERVKVKFFARHALHAKLYLAHRNDHFTPIVGFVGSSNLTFAGLKRQGELNVDVDSRDAAEKLNKWFQKRWDDQWCLDITHELAEIIERSWVVSLATPYHIYLKTAYHLSQRAYKQSCQFKIPKEFKSLIFEFQERAVQLAVERLNRRRGVIIGDVVGLGKTLVATAVAKILQEDQDFSVLVICPPSLEAMWEEYLQDYKIAGKILSLGKLGELEDLRRYRLVIIDESHNLRNRDTARWKMVEKYLCDNESHVILLTATPYNKSFVDIANQLRLFVDATADIGIRPDGQIQKMGGIDKFKMKHTAIMPSSLAAFEKSDDIDDWRELVNMFMIRRTRSHIKRNYAEYDSARDAHYLLFKNKERYYFPKRVPRRASFELKDENPDDQYAKLYSASFIGKIGQLQLPRYGLAEYLSVNQNEMQATEKEQLILDNLARGGTRLRGFAKIMLFKRLESCGPAFLISLRRHILRNAIFLWALKAQKQLPIGASYADIEYDDLNDDKLLDEFVSGNNKLDIFLNAAEQAYQKLIISKDINERIKWLNPKFFNQDKLKRNLTADAHAMLSALESVPKWKAEADRKLSKLIELCTKDHPDDKLLIFTAYSDTAEYLYDELQKRGVKRVEKIAGGDYYMVKKIRRFSPVANSLEPKPGDEIRIMVATDILSEGQNLQDAHIVINFDLPWALIRLVQRIGRIDRIGQKSSEILCYSFMPEDGVEKVLKLRGSLKDRIRQNAEVVGSDERFFDDDDVDLRAAYDEKLDLEEPDDETDLISRAYEIWRQATKNDAKLQAKIEGMPAVVYSAKTSNQNGVITYLRDSHEQDILAEIDLSGNIVSQSQSRIFDKLACEPVEQRTEPDERHHELVAKTVQQIRESWVSYGGQLGGARSIRRRIYDRMNNFIENTREQMSLYPNLKPSINKIYNHPLQEQASNRLSRALGMDIPDDALAEMIVRLADDNLLISRSKTDAPKQMNIICSMGLTQDQCP